MPISKTETIVFILVMVAAIITVVLDLASI